MHGLPCPRDTGVRGLLFPCHLLPYSQEGAYWTVPSRLVAALKLSLLGSKSPSAGGGEAVISYLGLFLQDTFATFRGLGLSLLPPGHHC